jgi:glucan biosynthesis protein
MDLQDFVTATLCQISAGVAIAKNYDRCVAPRVGIGDSDPKILRTLADADGVFLVDFDVAVTTSDATENGAPANITVLSVPPAKGNAKRSIENWPGNRVKFSVPISYR